MLMLRVSARRRGTCATTTPPSCSRGGVNPSKVAERLGHDLETLLATYAHVMPRDDDKVRSIVDATLGGSAEDWLSRGELRR